MKLAYWMYAGPAHIGTLRVASSFKNVHAIMHAPLGDDYFNVMRSMLERERDFTPVTASIVDRHVLARGSQEKVIENILRKDTEEKPDLILLTPTCTSSILQEDLQNFADRAALESKSDVILADVNHYRVNEIQAADRTLEQVVRFYMERFYIGPKNQEKHKNTGHFMTSVPSTGNLTKTTKPSANILGIFTLGFHHQHDCRELKRLLCELGIEVNLVIPEGGSVNDLKRLPEAWFNIVPYREIGCMTAQYLEKEFGMPYVLSTPMGIIETASFIREIETILNTYTAAQRVAFMNSDHASDSHPSDRVPNEMGNNLPALKPSGIEQDISSAKLLGTRGASPRHSSELDGHFSSFNFQNYIEKQTRFVSDASWFSRSIDCQNLTGKKSVVFGDATHAAAMTKILAREMGIRVSCAGTYCKHDADWFREQVSSYCDQVLITDDHNEVANVITKIEPSAIFGTQMERHIGKRLGIPCGVISAPVHIQNFPLGFRPFLGYEGTNQISDLVYNSFSLGMEEKLLLLFSGHDTKASANLSQVQTDHSNNNISDELSWDATAWQELQNIPSFVRGKVKRNVESFVKEHYSSQLENGSISSISLQLMYEAKEKVSSKRA